MSIEPLPGAHLITGMPYTVEGWGDNAKFYERSEQSYASLQNSLQDYFEKYGRGRFKYQDQVPEDYFKQPTHMLAQPSNLTAQEWDELLGNFNVKATGSYGEFNVAPNGDHNILLTKDGMLQIYAANQDAESLKLYERWMKDPTSSYPDIHEYLHSIDKAAGGDSKMSAIMGNYLTEALPYRVQNSRSMWTEQALYERWMKDPKTEHLSQVSREGFGKFLARAFMDDPYQNKHSGDTYKLSNSEIFARAIANTIKPYGRDEGFTSKEMFGDLEEGFSNALASFLNSRTNNNKP